MPFGIPESASAGTTYARFRLTSAGIEQPIGAAPDGEVEDYAVDVTSLRLVVSLTVDPPSVPEPGGEVTFTVGIENVGTATAVVLRLYENAEFAGDLDGYGSCELPQVIASGQTYTCLYSATVYGNAGEFQDHRVAAEYSLTKQQQPYIAQAHRVVFVTDVLPTIAIDVVASPTVLPLPGGKVVFAVEVANTGSAEAIVLDGLVDDWRGDLSGLGTCAVPQTIAAGGTYTCNWETFFVGFTQGVRKTRHVWAVVHDDDRNAATAGDSVMIQIIKAIVFADGFETGDISAWSGSKP